MNASTNTRRSFVRKLATTLAVAMMAMSALTGCTRQTNSVSNLPQISINAGDVSAATNGSDNGSVGQF